MMISNMINSSGKSIIIIVGFACATEMAWRIYKKYNNDYKKNQCKIQVNKPIADVLFFSEQSTLCRTHINFNVPCSMSSCPMISLNKLVSYLSSATRTLDICVYFLTCNAIVSEILKMQKKNIIVRVITDEESSSNESSQIFNLRKAGIKVRTKNSIYLMHHKFAIVDRKLLINGSANWTIQAFFGNCENILITNQNEIVSAYVNEFEKLWLRYNGEFNTDIQNSTAV